MGTVTFISSIVLFRQGLTQFGEEGLVGAVLGRRGAGWMLSGVSEYKWSHVGTG